MEALGKSTNFLDASMSIILLSDARRYSRPEKR